MPVGSPAFGVPVTVTESVTVPLGPRVSVDGLAVVAIWVPAAVTVAHSVGSRVVWSSTEPA